MEQLFAIGAAWIYLGVYILGENTCDVDIYNIMFSVLCGG